MAMVIGMPLNIFQHWCNAYNSCLKQVERIEHLEGACRISCEAERTGYQYHPAILYSLIDGCICFFVFAAQKTPSRTYANSSDWIFRVLKFLEENFCCKKLRFGFDRARNLLFTFVNLKKKGGGGGLDECVNPWTSKRCQIKQLILFVSMDKQYMVSCIMHSHMQKSAGMNCLYLLNKAEYILAKHEWDVVCIANLVLKMS